MQVCKEAVPMVVAMSTAAEVRQAEVKATVPVVNEEHSAGERICLAGGGTSRGRSSNASNLALPPILSEWQTRGNGNHDQPEFRTLPLRSRWSCDSACGNPRNCDDSPRRSTPISSSGMVGRRPDWHCKVH